ncbi:uncharacterized protein LOC115051343 isoform X2 [Echeneis naucrates]|uniref:uncharacterized protein LOC115051343 isoform X2 n=1 Tax=Echeneis naucrates TaxID=173247 RepID=UPI0011144C4A|nr:uncharacterized protein LOC115051343 isoform X2 [Echeneis naucrates]XP_029370602.1 uncharacterized protein LOC115051343 isoform X2 [Echeneis naucrates]
MAGVSVASQLVMPDFQQCNRTEGRDYQALVSQFVITNKNKKIKLKNPAGAILRVAGLEDTIYRGKNEEVNGWGKFYLPEIVNMQVLGVVEGTSCTCDQLVLMTCEDKNLYAYDGEKLHLVASSLQQLDEKKIDYPASKTYYNGEAFQDMTEKDWDDVRSGPVGRLLEQKHQELVKANKSALLASLK